MYEKDTQIAEDGFTLIGHLAEITGFRIYERFWLWAREIDGETIVTFDEGNGYCSVISKFPTVKKGIK